MGHTPSSKRTTARVPVTADEPRGSYPSRSFQQVPDEAGETPTTESFLLSSSTSLQGGPGGNEVANAGAAPFRNGGASTGFTSGYDVISGAYREQRYAINPLLWMQNVKKVGPPSELKNAKLAENTYQTVAEEMATVLPKYANAGVKIEKVQETESDNIAKCPSLSLYRLTLQIDAAQFLCKDRGQIPVQRSYGSRSGSAPSTRITNLQNSRYKRTA